MRPDPHKQKKSAAYRHKHCNVVHNPVVLKDQHSTVQSTALTPDQGQAEYLDIPDAALLDVGQNGRDYKQLSQLQNASVSAHNPFADPLDQAPASALLQLDISQIERSIRCLPLHQLLGLDPLSLEENFLVGVNELAHSYLQCYLVNEVDSRTIVNHDIRVPLTPQEVLFKNTGMRDLRSLIGPLETPTVLPPVTTSDSVLAVLPSSIHHSALSPSCLMDRSRGCSGGPTLPEPLAQETAGATASLQAMEDWLDSVLQ